MSLIFATIGPKRLAQGITSASTSFYVNNILGFDGINNVLSTDLGTQHYCVFRNDTGTRIEIMEIDPTTISTGPVTIVRRGLSYYGDRTTQTTALKFDWSANETIVQFGTDAPQIFQYLKEYIDAAAIAGAVPASTTTLGLVEEATQAEVDARTVTGGTGGKLFAPLDKIRGTKYHDYIADAGASDAYAITVVPAITAYTVGQEFSFKANTINTGPATLNVCALGAKTIKKDVSVDLDDGDIKANQIVKVIYDGTNFQLVSRIVLPLIPVINTYSTASTSVGSSTTQFDITNPSGTTFRYTYDGTGTDPSFSAVNYPVGTPVYFNAQNFSAGNNGVFLVTNSGANFVEVTNVSGVAENNKTIGTQYVIKGVAWTKPAGLKYIMVEMVGSGGGGGGASSGGGGSGGGGSGAYCRKIIAAASLGAKEGVIVGIKGAAGVAGSNNGSIGKPSVFGNLLLYAAGGAGGEFNPGGSIAAGGQGGSATGGNVNLDGGIGGNGMATDAGSNRGYGGYGGVSYFGGGGPAVGVTSGATSGQTSLVPGGGGSGGVSQSGTIGGGDGAPGLVIVTEFYI